LTAVTEYGFRRQAIRQAELKAAQRAAPAYMYLLTWETPVQAGKLGSPHSLDLALMFDAVDASRSMVGDGPEPQIVADHMVRAWSRFAHAGEPGWPEYATASRATMLFGLEPEVVHDPRPDERLLFAEAGPAEASRR
jgi:para-nitrobenzyl esterase